MKNVLFHYLKITGILVFAFLISSMLLDGFFLNNSPILRKNAPQYLVKRILLIPDQAKNYIARLTSPNYDKLLKDVSSTTVAKGVYAKQTEKATYIEYHLNQVDWIEYTFIVNGKTIKIKSPKGSIPPTQHTAEFFAESSE
ncbi:hypothetical protein HGA88_06535 [Candidatus Roizmanbacteria bacterium]|nr:hypothetical protein [Candidatus Roizmanbacteria bacterium]